MKIPEQYQLRVLNEHAELKDKVEKLSAYIAKNDDIQQNKEHLLIKQLKHMADYLDVLENRISQF